MIAARTPRCIAVLIELIEVFLFVEGGARSARLTTTGL